MCDVSQDDWIDKGFDKQLAFQMAVLNRSHEQVQAEVQQASEDSRELDWHLMLATLMEAGQGMSDWEARKKVLLQENDLAFAHALQEHEWADATTTTVGDDPSPGVSPPAAAAAAAASSLASASSAAAATSSAVASIASSAAASIASSIASSAVASIDELAECVSTPLAKMVEQLDTGRHWRIVDSQRLSSQCDLTAVELNKFIAENLWHDIASDMPTNDPSALVILHDDFHVGLPPELNALRSMMGEDDEFSCV